MLIDITQQLKSARAGYRDANAGEVGHRSLFYPCYSADENARSFLNAQLRYTLVPMPRKKLQRTCVFELVFIACALASGNGQSTFPSCSEVHVYASVLNRKKQVVGGLLPRDFTAQLNGRPAQVKDVQHNPYGHRVAILVDHSASMLVVWPAVYASALEMVRQLPDGITISVISFDKEILDLVSPTNDRVAISHSLSQFFRTNLPKSRTRLFDAIDTASNHFVPNTPGDMIYVITDGADNASDRIDKIKKHLISARTRLFAVILRPSSPASSEERYGPIDLHEVIQQTGGTYIDWYTQRGEQELTQRELVEISAGTRWIVQNMIDQYDLTVDSNQPLSSKTKVRIQVNVPGLKDPRDNTFTVVTQPLIATGCQ